MWENHAVGIMCTDTVSHIVLYGATWFVWISLTWQFVELSRFACKEFYSLLRSYICEPRDGAQTAAEVNKHRMHAIALMQYILRKPTGWTVVGVLLDRKKVGTLGTVMFS